MRYLLGDRVVELPLHRLCLLWGSMPHRSLSSEQQAELTWVTVPLDMLLKMPLGRRFMDRLMTRGLLVDPAPMGRDAEMLDQWVTDIVDGDARRQRVVRLEVEARLHRLAAQRWTSGAAARPARLRKGTLSPHLRAMLRFINKHLEEAFTVDQIAEHVGLTANHTMTLFRRQTGLTLMTYVTRQRVAWAQRMLLTTSTPVLSVGHRCGFGSTSRFYEAFSRETATSPARFRREHRAEPS